MKSLKDKLNDGEAMHGCWLNGGSALDAEIVGKCGFDWVTIDLEHGVGSENNLLGQLQALNGSSTVPLVRVEALVRQRVGRTLDLGARGIIFPMIHHLNEAKQAVSFMKYPPNGVRGMATMTRAVEFGPKFDEYYRETTGQLLGILQIENVQCLDYLDDIASLDGVDVLFVGPADMTLSLGIFKEFEHPKFIEVLKKVQVAANKHGKATGVLMSSPAEYEKYHGLGYRMLGCGSDSVFLLRGAQNMVQAMKEQSSIIIKN